MTLVFYDRTALTRLVTGFWEKTDAIGLVPCGKHHLRFTMSRMCSVTRLGDLLHFGQLFKACGNNYFAQIAFTFLAIFVNLSKSFILQAKSFLGDFYGYLATFHRSR